jgi:uncharacterized DUF497 family protein
VPPLFDPTKDAENLKNHGLSLAFGTRVLTDPRYVEVLDDRFNYGEERWNVLGMVNGKIYAATYTDREEGVRFISVRLATKREAKHYFLMIDR